MHPRILIWNIAIVAVLTDFTNMAVMLSDLLRNLNFNRSLHCTQVSDQWPLGLLLQSRTCRSRLMISVVTTRPAIVQHDLPNVDSESSPTFLKKQKWIISPRNILPNLVATTHSRFCFLNRISLFPKYRHITPPFFGMGYESRIFYLTNPTPTLVSSPVIMHFTISFPI